MFIYLLRYIFQITDLINYENDIGEYLHKILLEDKILSSMEFSQNPKSFEEMINSPVIFESISMPVNISKGELLLMILKYCITNSTSNTGMRNLFKLMNVIFQDKIMPDSQYFIDKLFNPMNKVEYHAMCPSCSAYIGKFGEIENVKKCRICSVELELTNPSSNTSFFVLLDPSSQIKDIVTMYENHYEYVVKDRIHEANYLEDVYDGKEYRKLVNSLSEEDKLYKCGF